MKMQKTFNRFRAELTQCNEKLRFGVDIYKPVLMKKQIDMVFTRVLDILNQAVNIAFEEGVRTYKQDLENAMVGSLLDSLKKRKLQPLWKEGKEGCKHSFTIVEPTRIVCEECGAYLDFEDLPTDLRPIDTFEEEVTEDVQSRG